MLLLVCIGVKKCMKIWLLKGGVLGMSGPQYFAPNQLLPNMLHHVRGKDSESAAVVLHRFSLLVLACGASERILPEQDLKNSLGV